MARERKVGAWLDWLNHEKAPRLQVRFHVWDTGDRKHVSVSMYVGPDLDHLAHVGALTFTRAEWNAQHRAFLQMGPCVAMGRRWQ